VATVPALERPGRAIAWATTIGALAYVLGRSASGSLGVIGFVGLGVAVLVYVITRIRRQLKLTARFKRQTPVGATRVYASEPRGR
jgi:hypothetical protein